MFLKRLSAKNFRSFDEIDIPLNEDLTVFVGENNGGKSNAIDAMRLITVPLNGRREIYCESTDIRFGSSKLAFELEAEFGDLSSAQAGRMLSAVMDSTLSACVFGLQYDEGSGRLPIRPRLWAGTHKETRNRVVMTWCATFTCHRSGMPGGPWPRGTQQESMRSSSISSVHWRRRTLRGN